MSAAHDHDARLEQELKSLKARHDKLRDEKLKTERDLENLNARLGELKARAKAEYGTDDPAQLARILDERRAENERLVAEYKEHVESIEAALRRVESGTGEEGA